MKFIIDIENDLFQINNSGQTKLIQLGENYYSSRILSLINDYYCPTNPEPIEQLIIQFGAKSATSNRVASIIAKTLKLDNRVQKIVIHKHRAD